MIKTNVTVLQWEMIWGFGGPLEASKFNLFNHVCRFSLCSAFQLYLVLEINQFASFFFFYFTAPTSWTNTSNLSVYLSVHLCTNLLECVFVCEWLSLCIYVCLCVSVRVVFLDSFFYAVYFPEYGIINICLACAFTPLQGEVLLSLLLFTS